MRDIFPEARVTWPDIQYSGWVSRGGRLVNQIHGMRTSFARIYLATDATLCCWWSTLPWCQIIKLWRPEHTNDVTAAINWTGALCRGNCHNIRTLVQSSDPNSASGVGMVSQKEPPACWQSYRQIRRRYSAWSAIMPAINNIKHCLIVSKKYNNNNMWPSPPSKLARGETWTSIVSLTIMKYEMRIYYRISLSLNKFTRWSVTFCRTNYFAVLTARTR